MLEIQVFFGMDQYNEPDDPRKKQLGATYLDPDPAAAHSGDDIFWHFHALDARIKSVVITFSDPADKFFECRENQPPTNECYANLHAYGHYLEGHGAAETEKAQEMGGTAVKVKTPRTSVGGGHGHLLGTAPSFGGGVKVCKYTITAYSGASKSGSIIEKFTLDPNVVTCDP